MNLKRLIFVILLPILLMFCLGCQINDGDDLSSLTHPYTDQYKCQKAMLGSNNLLDDIENLTIILQENGTAEIILKELNKPIKKFCGEYNVDNDTRELTMEFGILGYKFKPRTIIENGKFNIVMQINNSTLYLQFSSQ